MAGIVTSTAPSATPASLVTLPVSVTGCCAPSRSGAAQSAANKTRTNRRQRTRMFPPPYVCVDGPSSAHENWGNWANALHGGRSEEHTSELQSQSNLVCRLLLEKKKTEC